MHENIAAIRALSKQLEGEIWEALSAHPHRRVLKDLEAASQGAHVNLGWLEHAPDENPDAAVNAAWCLGKVHTLAGDLQKDPSSRERAKRWETIAAEMMGLLRPERPVIVAPQEAI